MYFSNMKRLFFSFLLLVPFGVACNDRFETIENDLSALREQLSEQEELLTILQSGRTISSIDIDETGTGYILTFMDGESIRISDGKTPIITIGENGNWYINGSDTGEPSRGSDGTCPTLSIVNGNWYIDNLDTGVRAEASDGVSAPTVVSILDSPAMMSFIFSDGSIINVEKTLPAVGIRSDYSAGQLAYDEALTLACNYIRKNVIITATLDKFPSSGKIRLGRGKDNDFSACWIDIDTESVKIIRLSSGGDVLEEYQHGMSFTGPVDIIVDYGDNRNARITLFSGAESYEFSGIYAFAGGETSIKNLSDESINCSVRFFPKDSGSKIWIVGDSYIDWRNPARWPYYIYSLGYTSWLGDHLSGANSRLMLSSFKNDLQFGRPEYVLWMLGMNDGSDSEGQPSEIWLSSINEFLQICDLNGITPVLSTIPSVPARNHVEKTRWVHESGRRFIDIAAAVEKEASNGQWFEGFLSSDNVHPTNLGAEAMARKVLVDFPEITIFGG